MTKDVKVATSNANEMMNAAAAANVEQPKAQEVAAVDATNEAESQPCCPKAKTTVLAVIEGAEREITLARSIYNMEELKKGQVKLLEEVDKSKLLDQIYHFAKPEIFWMAGITLYNMEGEVIPEGTEDVLVPVETSNTYWRFSFDEVLKNVQVHTFESVEEYAQVAGATDLFSRTRNTVEKIGVAALATGDETYKAVYELSRRTGMPGSTAMAYLGVQIKGTTTLAMSMGLTRKDVPVAKRSFEDAFALYQQICFTFTPAEAKKRYPVRAVNSVMHVGGYDLATIMDALKGIPSHEVHRAMLMDCGTKEACIGQVLLNFIMGNQRKATPIAA